ncbi:hypothetical protein M0802_001477 [Mischocyttarus mexicanus]|nr:hypothetical protein M0802_001477 [Mischocyttarus mexicanus]
MIDCHRHTLSPVVSQQVQILNDKKERKVKRSKMFYKKTRREEK